MCKFNVLRYTTYNAAKPILFYLFLPLAYLNLPIPMIKIN
jgi:hypothetical protein